MSIFLFFIEMLGMSWAEYLCVFWIGFPQCMKGQEEMLYSTGQYFCLICSSFFFLLFSSAHRSDNSKQRFINYFTCVHWYWTQLRVNACCMHNVKEENIFLVAITKRFHYSWKCNIQSSESLVSPFFFLFPFPLPSPQKRKEQQLKKLPVSL